MAENAILYAYTIGHKAKHYNIFKNDDENIGTGIVLMALVFLIIIYFIFIITRGLKRHNFKIKNKDPNYKRKIVDPDKETLLQLMEEGSLR